jgi:DNA-binding CsgD family transcriptional regulator
VLAGATTSFACIEALIARRFIAVFSQFEAFHDKLAQTSTLGELGALIREVRDAYHLAHVVYHAVHLPRISDPNPILLLTYDPEWVRRYTERDYFRIDPVVVSSRNIILPLDWADVDHESPEMRRFFKEADAIGVGRHGMTIPIRGPGSERALLSITSNASTKVWKDSRFIYMREFLMIAHFIHDGAVRLAGVPGIKRPLSAREREILQLAARGLAPKQIAADLRLSGTAVRLYLQGARSKLECSSLSQGVAKAVSLNIIEA